MPRRSSPPKARHDAAAVVFKVELPLALPVMMAASHRGSLGDRHRDMSTPIGADSLGTI